MSPSKRFKPVLRIAESRELKAAHQLGDSQRKRQEQEARLHELRQYHQEYLEQFNASAARGMSAAQLREYQAFLAKLEQAIQEQESVVQMSHIDCTAKENAWKQKHIHSQALDKMVQRFQAEEQRILENKEQQESDERSQRGGKS